MGEGRTDAVNAENVEFNFPVVDNLRMMHGLHNDSEVKFPQPERKKAKSNTPNWGHFTENMIL